MVGVIERARADLASGQRWKARDRLAGALVAQADDELLGLLGEVYFAMGDLPAAGAVWFGSTRQGPAAEAAGIAWRDRHGHDDLQLWLSLPPLVRHGANTPAVEALQTAAAEAAAARRRNKHRVPRDAPLTKRTLRLSTVVGAVKGMTGAAVLVVGLVTIVRWFLF
ncbi:DUF6584 family protein [Pengzhenrongella sp.]|jgi:hypothetical protein|uniref:DUF6584 family protein n=1 Tax=Pengzhenrongella sp. TaxID=2888820 RepID=UPI002F93F576